MTHDPVPHVIVALAECFRGDGEILASPIGVLPTIGMRLARATFAPDLMSVDDGWIKYREIFDRVWSGRRHVIMGASQIDRFGNQNIACIGDPAKPKAQLLGMRGAPGNTINHATSYFVPAHSRRVFVPKVDVVTGIGTDRAAALGAAGRFHDLRRVVSNLAVLDFGGQGKTMRLVSVHPGVSVAQVVEATGFELAMADEVPETRGPTAEELEVLRRLDPDGKAAREIPA
jgi:acyl CoA:acetate/3-ketoacid CoA transferase beta subunit